MSVQADPNTLNDELTVIFNAAKDGHRAWISALEILDLRCRRFLFVGGWHERGFDMERKHLHIDLFAFQINDRQMFVPVT